MWRVLLFFLPFNLLLHREAIAQLYWLPFEELFEHAEVVLEGRVLAQQSFWDTGRRNIYTAYEVEVFRVYRGHARATARMMVVAPGGIVGDMMELVSENVDYAIGDYGLFCLNACRWNLPISPLWENYGGPHGFFRYDFQSDAVDHPFHATSGIVAFRQRVERLTDSAVVWLPDVHLPPAAQNRMPPSIGSFSPTSISAGTGDVLTISGSGFGTSPGTVRFLDANTGSPFSVDASDITGWSDTEITVIVPSTLNSGSSCAGTGPVTVVDASNNTATSSSDLMVMFGYTNFLFSGNKVGAKLVNANGMGGMTFTLSTTLCSSGTQDAANAVGRALREWRCVSGVNWRLSTSTTSVNATASDGINIITYDVGTPLPSGVLGRATSYYSACFSGGNFHWRVNEIDINMKQSVSWYFCDSPTVPGGSFDFQSVAFHEFGHGHQLQHIIDNTAVMHRSIGPGEARRVLNANEESGADYVLSLPSNPCGPGPMTLLTHPACLSLTPPSACNGAGTCTAPMPVELLYFKAVPVSGGILLTWETATERDNAFFTVERSGDALHFEMLGRIRGAGNSTQRRKYEYLDAAPLLGSNYYRLWQTDYDGTSTLLNLAYVEVAPYDVEPFRIYPNPLLGEQLWVELPPDTHLEGGILRVFDMWGREVVRQVLSIDQLGVIDLAPYGLAAGCYAMELQAADGYRSLGRVRVCKP